MFKKLLFIIIGSISFTLTAFADASEGLELSISLGQEEFYVGDKIEFSIEVKTRKGTKLELQDWEQENFSGLAIQDFGHKLSNSLFNTHHKYWFILDTYLSAEYEIAGLSLRYRTADDSDWHIKNIASQIVEVKSLLSDDDIDIRPIISPQGRRKPFIIIASFLILLLLAVAIAVFLYFRKRPKKIIEIFISPEQEAQAALAKLIELELENARDLKEFFSSLSYILRRYIERQFKVKAPEMTTEEFILYIRHSEFMQAKYKELLSNFFALADMVKFAKYASTRDEAMDSYQSVKLFVEETSVKDEEEDDL